MYSFFPQLRPTSIEKEVFPEMAEDGNLFAMELKGRATYFLGWSIEWVSEWCEQILDELIEWVSGWCEQGWVSECLMEWLLEWMND